MQREANFLPPLTSSLSPSHILVKMLSQLDLYFFVLSSLITLYLDNILKKGPQLRQTSKSPSLLIWEF